MKKFTTILCAAAMAASLALPAAAGPSPNGEVITSQAVIMTVNEEQMEVVARTLTVSDTTDTAAVEAAAAKAAAPAVEAAKVLTEDPEVIAKVEEAVTKLAELAVTAAATEDLQTYKETCEIYKDNTKTEDGKIRIMNADGTEAEIIEGETESVSDIFTFEMRKVSDPEDAEGTTVVLDQTFDFAVSAEALGVTEEDTLVISVYTLEADEELGVVLVETYVKAVVENGVVKATLPANAIAAEVLKVK